MRVKKCGMLHAHASFLFPKRTKPNNIVIYHPTNLITMWQLPNVTGTRPAALVTGEMDICLGAVILIMGLT
jgi:hypothetical protein